MLDLGVQPEYFLGARNTWHSRSHGNRAFLWFCVCHLHVAMGVKNEIVYIQALRHGNLQTEHPQAAQCLFMLFARIEGQMFEQC